MHDIRPPQPEFHNATGIIQSIIILHDTACEMVLPKNPYFAKVKENSLCNAQLLTFPMVHSSTPMISNFSPSSLKGSLPNVRQELLMPFSNESSSHRP